MCHRLQWRIQDFPEEGAPTPRGARQHTILPKFPKNHMKLKEFGPRGGGARPLSPPLDPPLGYATSLYLVMVSKYKIKVTPTSKY